MKVFSTAHEAGRLRKLVLALARPLTPAQIRLPAAGWGRFERVALALYWELALQLDFFDEEIEAFCTLWCPFAGKQSPLSSY
ncbi:hypothetical protein GRW34_22640, partial [Escherichia coli]|nr:hypothetical protein [Escherichia coli]